MSCVFAALLGLPGAVCCDRGPSEREEARRFLAAWTDLEAAEGLDAQQQRLQALQKMRFNFDHIRETRDRCVAAQTGLVLAEAAQTNIRTELLQAQQQGGQLSPEQTARLGAAVRRASSDYEVAQSAFEHCRDETRKMGVKFR